MTSELTRTELVAMAEHLMAAKMFSLASCVMLFYDIALTFGDEVEKIWKQRFTGATVLWYLNRYLSPLGYIVVIVSFHDPWPKSVCNRYVLYPEILKIFTAFVVGVVFIIRLYSIYSRSLTVLGCFTLLLLVELSVKIWAFTDGTMLELPPGLVGCILVGKSSAGDRFVYTWVAELVFDTLVFLATLYRTICLHRTAEAGAALPLIIIIMRDGIMYFAAIFASNLVTVLLFVSAPADLKAVNASFSTLITSLMVSRLMLNLRREALRRKPILDYRITNQTGVADASGSNEGRFAVMTSTWSIEGDDRSFEDSIIGNLGATVTSWGDEAEEAVIEDGCEEEGTGQRSGLEMGAMRRAIRVQVTQEIVVDDGSRTSLTYPSAA